MVLNDSTALLSLQVGGQPQQPGQFLAGDRDQLQKILAESLSAWPSSRTTPQHTRPLYVKLMG
jgi:hypothetical protein